MESQSSGGGGKQTEPVQIKEAPLPKNPMMITTGLVYSINSDKHLLYVLSKDTADIINRRFQGNPQSGV